KVSRRQAEPILYGTNFGNGQPSKLRPNPFWLNSDFASGYANHISQVVGGRLRHREDMIGLLNSGADIPGVVAQAVGGLELRVIQKIEIVNRDNGVARPKTRWDEIGAVEHVQ